MDFFKFLLSPLVWITVVVVLVILTIRNYRKVNRLQVLNVDSVLLMIEIPKDNDKKELSAEQLFASLHGILRDAQELKSSGGVQEHLSFEIASVSNQIRFFVWVPKVLQSFVEGQIYSQYPSVQIYRMKEDYVDRRKNYPVNYCAEIALTDNEALPIKTFDSFEVDPLAGITGTLAKLNPNGGEELWIQILTRPVADDWHKNTDKWITKVKSGKKGLFSGIGIDHNYNVIYVAGTLTIDPLAVTITAKEKVWRANERGSDSRFSFNWRGKSDRVFLFEGPIDMLSYISMYCPNWQ